MAQEFTSPQLNPSRQAIKLLVRGIVQGVGFRPFVYTLAQRFHLAGWVRNTSSGVEILLEGSSADLAAWQQALQRELPPLAHIDSIAIGPAQVTGFTSFTILDSAAQSGGYQPIPADAATCPQCLQELFTPADRRYRYPFTNCTNCGPRFTIINDIPYDRPNTTMRRFTMCPACQQEYDNPSNRRFHAQPNACPLCGPQVALLDANGNELAQTEDALAQAASMLQDGKILAIKGLGGFQIACDATNQDAVMTLRERKHRPAKPFAIMLANLQAISACVALTNAERTLLLEPSAPIVLCKAHAETLIASGVAPNLSALGVMLPYTPLHHLLLHDIGLPLVMTSANLSEEPLACDNAEALQRLGGIADAFLVHNRDINTRLDDSVFFVVGEKPQPVRRARGFAPSPLILPEHGPSVLACGAELKNTFCLTRDNYAFLSQHLGDMQNMETWDSFQESLQLYKHLFHTEPELVAYDMHPGYMPTKYALSQSSLQRVAIQHHHAHLAACLADAEYAGPVIGVIFDGTGYGLDGSIWGGEFLLGDASGFVRAGRLQSVPLLGGEAAINNPYRLAWAYWRTLLPERPLPPSLAMIPENERGLLQALLDKRVNTLLTTSAGRLFDAVSAMLGVCQVASYEAQAAMELEAVAEAGAGDITAYPYELNTFNTMHSWGKAQYHPKAGIEIGLAPLLRAIIGDIAIRPLGHISYRFHITLAQIITHCCRMLSAESGLTTVALSGGCFQNKLLLELTTSALQTEGFEVILHHRVPCNDGGLSLGQAVIARTQY